MVDSKPSTEGDQLTPAQVDCSPSMLDAEPSTEVDQLPPVQVDLPPSMLDAEPSTEDDQLPPVQVDLSSSMVDPKPSTQFDSLPFLQDGLPPSRDNTLNFPQDNPHNDHVPFAQDFPLSIQDDPLPFTQGDSDSLSSTENAPISAPIDLSHSTQENPSSSIRDPSNRSDHLPTIRSNPSPFSSRNTFVKLIFRSWLPWT